MPMTDTPVSPLRRRMIEDMTIRKFAPRTQEGYIRAVKNFSAFLGASPDKAGFEDVRRYQLHLVSSGAGVPTINHTLTALRFLFMVTLRKPDVVIHLPFVRQARKLPVVLSPEEVARLLEAAPGLKYKAALSVAYAAGLRASELVSLKVCDIDSARMVIRVEQGKGRKDRYVMLSEASSCASARMVEGGAATGLAVSRAEPGQPSHDTPAQPRLPHRGASG
jgi:integrase/recombinase XerD